MVHVDILTVRTTLRLWHDLHVATATAYDFEHLFAPAQTRQEFVAAVLDGEVHALARCEVGHNARSLPLGRLPGSGWRLEGVAHAPRRSEAADALVRMLATEGARPHPRLSDRQSRWCVAMAFYVDAR
jgi:hypothetical protein